MEEAAMIDRTLFCLWCQCLLLCATDEGRRSWEDYGHSVLASLYAVICFHAGASITLCNDALLHLQT